MNKLWKRLEYSILESPFYLEASDICVYARDYVSGGGFKASEANQLISNFKKPVSTKSTYQWPHKVKAALQFARELQTVLPKDGTVAFCPTSKRKDHPEYDPRFDLTERDLALFRKDITIVHPIVKKVSSDAVHLGAKKRKIQEVYETLEWHGFDKVPESIILIDDVITCGTHFKACQRLIREHHPNVNVYGVFWARTVWPDDE